MIRLLSRSLFICLFTYSSYLQADRTWDGSEGGTPQDYGDPDNWTPSTVPGSTDVAIFPDVSNREPTISVTSSLNTYNVEGIEFTASTTGDTYTLTIQDEKTLNIGSGGITNTGGLAHTISLGTGLPNPTGAFVTVTGPVLDPNLFIHVGNSTWEFLGNSVCNVQKMEALANITPNVLSSTIHFGDNSVCNGGLFVCGITSQIIFDGSSVCNGGQFTFFIGGIDIGAIHFNIDGVIGENVTLTNPTSSNPHLFFNPPTELTVNALISLSGRIEIEGTGRTILNATYSSGSPFVNVNSGATLAVNTPQNISVHVLPGGRLEGIGSIASNLCNNGTIAPGFNGLAGTFTISEGHYNNPAQGCTGSGFGTYEVLIDANGNNSKIVQQVSNSNFYAYLNTTDVVVLVADPRSIVGTTTYSIFETDNATVVGPFASVTTSSNPLITVSQRLVNNDKEVVIDVTVVGTNDPISPNQDSVLNAIYSIDNPNEDQLVWLTAFADLPPSEIPNALDQIGGEQYTNYVEVSYNATNRFSNRLKMATKSRVLCRCPCEPDYFGWIDAGGGQGEYDGDSLAKGLDTRNYFVNGGVQVLNDCGWTLGIAASYEKEDLDFDLNGSADADIYQGALYTAWNNANGYFLANAIYGCNHFKMNRRIQFGTIDRTAHSTGRVWAGTFYGEAGLTNHIGCMATQQYAGADFSYYYQRKIKENGADTLDLEVDALKSLRYDFLLGSRFQLRLPSSFSLELDLNYRHRFNAQRLEITTLLADTSTPMKIKSFKLGKNGLEGSLTLMGTICGDLQWYLRATGECWSHYKAFAGTTGFILHW